MCLARVGTSFIACLLIFHWPCSASFPAVRVAITRVPQHLPQICKLSSQIQCHRQATKTGSQTKRSQQKHRADPWNGNWMKKATASQSKHRRKKRCLIWQPSWGENIRKQWVKEPNLSQSPPHLYRICIMMRTNIIPSTCFPPNAATHAHALPRPAAGIAMYCAGMTGSGSKKIPCDLEAWGPSPRSGHCKK